MCKYLKLYFIFISLFSPHLTYIIFHPNIHNSYSCNITAIQHFQQQYDSISLYLQGSSISQLISILQSNLRCKYLIFGIGLTITGRIISHMKTLSGLDALCVSSFSNTILDCGYISFISSVGLVGLKVSIIQ